MSSLLHQLGIHKWVYRNPYDRTCDICHKRQNYFDYVFRKEDDSGDYWANNGHWEDMYPLPEK